MIIHDILPSGVTHPTAECPFKVLFICLGNICRSPAADGILHKIVEEHNCAALWEIDSAGTGGYHIGDLPDHRMRLHARRRGLELTHICRQVRPVDFWEFDLIIPMDHSNERNLRQMAPTAECESKIVPMARFLGNYSRFDHVPDPYYDGAEGFERVLDILDDGCLNIFDTVMAL